jgi:hypothetical protein
MKRQNIYLIIVTAFLASLLCKILKIFIIFSIFYLYSQKVIQSPILVFVIDSLLRFIMTFLIVFIAYLIMKSLRIKKALLVIVFFIPLFLLIELFVYLITGSLSLGKTYSFPTVELIAPGMLFLYYYLVNKKQLED